MHTYLTPNPTPNARDPIGATRYLNVRSGPGRPVPINYRTEGAPGTFPPGGPARADGPDLRGGGPCAVRTAVVLSDSSVFRDAVTRELEPDFEHVTAAHGPGDVDGDHVEPGTCVVLDVQRFGEEARTLVSDTHEAMRHPRAVAAFLPLSASVAQIVDAVLLVASGLTVLPVHLMPTGQLAAAGNGNGDAIGAGAGTPIAANDAMPLSKRECDVVDGIAKGRSNKQIARDLQMAEPTVRAHVRAILLKLDVHNRTQATVWALRHPSGRWS